MATTFPEVMVAEMRNSSSNYNEHYKTYATDSKGSFYEPDYLIKVIYSLIVLICIPGFVGNGIVIQHLGFKIKRTSSTVYILNLAVADCGLLIFLFLAGIRHLNNQGFLIELAEGLVWTYCIGQLFLTIISIDRCLALFFPVWYQYHQSIYLSTMVSAVAWIFSLFIYALNYALFGTVWVKEFPPFYHVLICTSVCVPLIVVSSLTLFIKGYLQPRTKRRAKLPKAILLAVLFFLVFSSPLIGVCLIDVMYPENALRLMTYGYFCACLNGSVNPLIYFLVGRKEELKTTCNLTISLQGVFGEEEENEKPPKVQGDIPLYIYCIDKFGGEGNFYISLPGPKN